MSNKKDFDAMVAQLGDEGLTPAEREALADAGDEAYATGEADNTPPTEAAPVEAKAEADAPAADPVKADEPKADAATTETPAVDAPVLDAETVPRFVTIKPEQVDEAKKAVAQSSTEIAAVDVKAEALAQQLETGELSTTDYIKQERALRTEADKLRSAQAEAQKVLDRAADQVEIQRAVSEQRWEDSLNAFFKDNAAYAGNDALSLVFHDQVRKYGQELLDGNKDATARQIFDEAHKRVQAKLPGMFEKKEPAKVASNEPVIDKKQTPKPPVSIAAMPSAASTQVLGEFSHLDALTGTALERALAAMPKDKQDRYALAA